MTYNFWEKFNDILPYDLQITFDVRLCNVVGKLEQFLKSVSKGSFKQEKLPFFLAGSCVKSDYLRDIDMIFPHKQDKEELNDTLDKSYFEYENNSYTYVFEEDIFQLVFREKFKDASLHYLVDGFDFDSTKIAFACILDTKTKHIEVVDCDLREEFVHYITTKVNNLSKISINPFVSLQRAIHFLKRGDDVPYSVFLSICSKIAELEIDKKQDKEKYFDRLQGNQAKLKDIKQAISQFVEEKRH